MKRILFTLLAVIASVYAYAVCTSSYTTTINPNGNNTAQVRFNNNSTYNIPSGMHAYTVINYGDGNVATDYSNSSTYTHTYGATGNYLTWIAILVVDSTPSGTTIYCKDTSRKSVSVTVGNPCASTISASRVGFNNKLSFTASTPAGSSGMSYAWSFGDATTGTGSTITHTYAAKGNYIVRLIASSTSNGCTDTSTINIAIDTLIYCNIADAKFNATTTANKGVSISNTSIVPGANVSSVYNFNYGDGSSLTTATTHTYAISGTYNITMYASWKSADSATICTDSAVKSVTIASDSFNCSNANASFTATVNNTTKNVILNINSTVKPSSNATFKYTYNYGDGSGYLTSNNHTYTTAGTYQVIMNAVWTNPADTTQKCTDTAVRQVVVSGSNTFNCNTANAVFMIINVNNGTVDVNRIGSTPPANSSGKYTFDYGDGTGYTTDTNHTYVSGGTYTIIMNAVWRNISDTTQKCTDTAMRYVMITIPGAFNCASASAYFTSTVVNSEVTVVNQSNPPTGQFYSSYLYSYGDASSVTANTVHTYAATGTYTISQVAVWTDTNNSANTCRDTFSSNVTINTLVNKITGMVSNDSGVSVTDSSFKVWLIAYDSAAQTLTAVDSAIANMHANSATFAFNNPAPGNYFVKAAQISSAPVFIPTYSVNTPYWSSAHLIRYSFGTTSCYISLIPGSPGAGPGFIGGSISAGANRLGRRTGNDVTDVLMLLRDNAGKPIASTRTDVDGKYYFGNIPAGNYDIYPELPGYATVVFHVSVVPGKDTVSDVNFHINTTTKTIAPKPTAITKVTSTAIPVIYPNPTTGIVNIQGLQKGLNKVTVTDVAGRVVLQTEINNTNSQLNLATFNAGIYFINIKAEGVNYTSKITLQR